MGGGRVVGCWVVLNWVVGWLGGGGSGGGVLAGCWRFFPHLYHKIMGRGARLGTVGLGQGDRAEVKDTGTLRCGDKGHGEQVTSSPAGCRQSSLQTINFKVNCQGQVYCFLIS